MPLIEANWKPTPRQLRQFGCLCAVGLPLVGWIWGAGQPTLIGLAAVGVFIAVTGWLVPHVIKPLFVGVMFVTIPIGMVIAEIAMFCLYGLVIVPIGIWFRLRRRDRLDLKIDRTSSSYWRRKAKPKSVASYYHQS